MEDDTAEIGDEKCEPTRSEGAHKIEGPLGAAFWMSYLFVFCL